LLDALFFFLLAVFCSSSGAHRYLHSFPTRRSSDLGVTLYGAASIMVNGNQGESTTGAWFMFWIGALIMAYMLFGWFGSVIRESRSEEHTSELQSRENLVCRLLLEKKKKKYKRTRQN